MQSRKDQLAREAMASAPAFYVALLLLLASVAAVHAVPPQAGTSSTCSTDLLRLLPCLPFIEGTATVPADTCCANLGSMVHDEPQCLCQALSNPSTAPVAVNMTRVMAMPRLCRLDLPPATGACAVAGLLPHGPSPPLPPPPPPPAAAVTPHASANSSAPATLTTPATPTPTTPRMIPSPSVSSQTPPRYSRGSKMIAHGFSVTLGFVALVSVLAF
ncbi:protease inhibitor/seed storage/LTP family protein precursor [Zea mays]|nr:protease inhibitor/seed storage/LTP family protein precursor [Zea mays]ACF87691.1 unknown [Zea mays]ONM16912.1 Bifunctional inhibitor/lipid-transfer protein/seed storage 2S albumin superfamily protein [Zea mays]